MAGLLTEEEKVRVRMHLGYLNVQEAMTFVLGLPAGVQTQFQVEGAMNRVLEAAMPQLRRHLNILDQIEAQMVEDLELLAIDNIDTIKVRADEQSKLREQYVYWRLGLANLLGISPNPFDKRYSEAGINVSVIH